MADDPLKKYESPKTIKEYYVNNMIDASERVAQAYTGTPEQRIELIGIVRDQARWSIINDDGAFFGDSTDAIFEKGLETKGPEVAKKIAGVLLEKRLPRVQDFPLDEKVRGEFVALTNSSLYHAIDQRAISLGKASGSTVAATNVPSQTNSTELVSVTK